MEHTELKIAKPEHSWMDSFSDNGTPLPPPLKHDQHFFMTPAPCESVIYPRLEFGTELLSTDNENQSFDFFENLPDVDTNFLASNFPEEIGIPLSNPWPSERLGPWGKISLAERTSYDFWADIGLSPSFIQLYSTKTKKEYAAFSTNVQKLDSNLCAAKIPEDVPTPLSSNPCSSKNLEAEVSKETSSKTPSTSYSELISAKTKMQHYNVFESLRDLDTNLMESQVLEEICTQLTNPYSSDHPEASAGFPIALRSRYNFCTDSQVEGHESFVANPSDQDTDHTEYECLKEIRPSSPNQRTPSYNETPIQIPVGERNVSTFCFENEWHPLPCSSQVISINHENQWSPEYPEDTEEISFVERSNYNMWNISQPHPTISCYTILKYQFVGDVYFYLDYREETTFLTPSFQITVLDPNNCPLHVEASLEEFPQLSRFIFTFHACTLGYYSVSILDCPLNFHIHGSPLIIPVSRNYRLKLPPRVFSDVVKKCWGIAYSHSVERVYVADRSTAQVFIFNRDGSLYKCFGGRGSGRSRFLRPTGIAVDHRNHRLIISDKDNHRICVYTLEGRLIFSFGQKGHKNGEFNFPWGVAVSPKDSSIVIADSRNHRIQLFDEYGQFIRKYGVFETNPFGYKTEFNYPRGVCFDNLGDTVYVTDFNIHVVHKFNAELTEKRRVPLSPNMLYRPQGIAVDPVGNLLICDSRHNCIRVTSPKGNRITTIYGRKGSSFFHPLDIDVTPTGKIIVVDLVSNIRVL